MNKENATKIPEGFEIHPSFQNITPDMQVAVMAGIKGEKGDKGAKGDAATISVGTVTTGEPGTDALVANVGSSSAAVLNFTIPKGAKGDTGDNGEAATVSVGTVTTGAAGSSASVTNSGTNYDAVLDFVIPQGAKGNTGDTGATGATGNGISSVTKTGTSGLVDTYTILYTNGDTDTFTVTNGKDGTVLVSSVNNKTGAVTLTASDVGALSSSTHIPAAPDFMYVGFAYSNGTVTCNKTFSEIVSAIGDGYEFFARFDYGTDTYMLNAVWDDDQGTDYIKFITADAKYVITYTSTSITLDTNAVSFDVVISVNNGTPSCNVTILDIIEAIWDGKTLNAVYMPTAREQISLSYYCNSDEDYGYCDFYGVDKNRYFFHIKYSIANGLEWINAPYTIQDLMSARAIADQYGDTIDTNYAKKSEIPTKTSCLNNDSGFITLSDIPAANGVSY